MFVKFGISISHPTLMYELHGLSLAFCLSLELFSSTWLCQVHLDLKRLSLSNNLQSLMKEDVAHLRCPARADFIICWGLKPWLHSTTCSSLAWWLRGEAYLQLTQTSKEIVVENGQAQRCCAPRRPP